ncbi:MAG: hypothetical protein EOP83_02125 [Verrucomicrobiaceae bacterium]|nr:MAG: hypothetical protein EOP83_02125 [Verrucomicrobiaceae bacterium]
MINEHPYYWDEETFVGDSRFTPDPPATWNRVRLNRPGQELRVWVEKIQHDFDAVYTWYPLIREQKENGRYPCMVASDNDAFLFLARIELG